MERSSVLRYIKKRDSSEDSSEYGEYRRKWNENPKNHIVERFPIHLDIESANFCNLKCKMCYHSFDKTPEQYTDFKPGLMEFELYKKIIDEGAEKGLCSVKLQFRGEALLHPRILDMVKYAKDKEIIEVMINTNAVNLTEENARGLIKGGLDKLICSVEGYTKEVYEDIRIGAKFEDVLENIKKFQKIKKGMDKEKPTVRVQMVDLPEIHDQVEGYKDFWSNIADEVSVLDMLEVKNNRKDITIVCKDFQCPDLWQRLIITVNGYVGMCCGDHRVIEVLGNVNEDSIEDIWHSERLNEVRNLHIEGESHKIEACRICENRKALIECNKDITYQIIED